MTEELPDPLVSGDIDLRDFGFMPLDVRRLLTSETWIEAADTPKIGHAVMCLWCEAWHQVPAASLPDNDKVLSRLAMCDPKTWKRIKEAVLVGWVKCSDGLLYHPVVAEKALESWAAKVKQRERTKAATEARESKRRAEQTARDAQRDVHRNESRNVERDEQRDVHQGTGTVKGQGSKPKTPSSSVNSTTVGPTKTEAAASASQEKPEKLPPVTTAGAWAIDLKRRGLDVTSMHPTLLAWIEDGFTLPQVIEAYEIGRKRIPAPEKLGANYIDPILRNPPKKADPAWWSTEAGITAKGKELGLNAKAGEDWNGFKSRIIAAIVAAKGGQGQIEKMLTQQRSEAA